MSNYKIDNESKNPMHVALFVSRNKDNSAVADFKERRVTFVTHATIDELKNKFKHFVEDGKTSEMCRLYYSVNARNEEKVYKELLHYLIDNPDTNLCNMDARIASIAAKNENAAEKKWMFDFDINDESKANDFVNDIKSIDNSVETEIIKTPNCYAIICSHGFDTRELYKKWDHNLTELKRDDLICAYWAIKDKGG